MNINFTDKVVIITEIIKGASSGIGQQIAVLFSKLGASLVLHGRNEKGLDETIEKCDPLAKSRIVKALGDIQNTETLKNIVNQAIQSFGKINILINNAGMFLGAENITNISMDNFDQVFSVNTRAAIELTSLCVKHLIDSKGNIVNVSSVCGTRAFTNLLSYEIAKAALDQFTKVISLELASKGVRVNSVNPGEVPTKMQARGGYNDNEEYYKATAAMHPLGRNATTDDVAKAVAFLASDDASFVTGEFIHLDGGLHNQCSSASFVDS